MVKTAFIIIREVQDWCVYMNLSLYINDPVPEFYVPSDWTFPRCVNSHLAICEPERSFTDTQWSPIRLGTCLASTKDNRACLKLKKKTKCLKYAIYWGKGGELFRNVFMTLKYNQRSFPLRVTSKALDAKPCDSIRGPVLYIYKRTQNAFSQD